MTNQIGNTNESVDNAKLIMKGEAPSVCLSIHPSTGNSLECASWSTRWYICKKSIQASENSQTSGKKNIETSNYDTLWWDRVQAAQLGKGSLHLLKGVRPFTERTGLVLEYKAKQEFTRQATLLSPPGRPPLLVPWQTRRQETALNVWPWAICNLHRWSVKCQGSSVKDRRPLWESDGCPAPSAQRHAAWRAISGGS